MRTLYSLETKNILIYTLTFNVSTIRNFSLTFDINFPVQFMCVCVCVSECWMTYEGL